MLGVDVENDDAQIHPPKYVLPPVPWSTVPHYNEWRQRHTQQHRIPVVSKQCRWMCYTPTHTYSTKGWEEEEKRLERPQRESVRALIMHARRKAPKLSTTSADHKTSYHFKQQELTCPVCTEIVQNHVELIPHSYAASAWSSCR